MSHSIIIEDENGNQYKYFPPHENGDRAAHHETATVARLAFDKGCKTCSVKLLTAKQSAATDNKTYLPADAMPPKLRQAVAQLFEGEMPE